MLLALWGGGWGGQISRKKRYVTLEWPHMEGRFKLDFHSGWLCLSIWTLCRYHQNTEKSTQTDRDTKPIIHRATMVIRCHSTLACSALTRVSFDPVSANASFARTVSFLRRNAFYASLARISFCVAYLFALMFPICEEVFSTPVWRVSRFAPMLIEYASMAYCLVFF